MHKYGDWCVKCEQEGNDCCKICEMTKTLVMMPTHFDVGCEEIER
jgi:hypothetical protein